MDLASRVWPKVYASRYEEVQLWLKGVFVIKSFEEKYTPKKSDRVVYFLAPKVATCLGGDVGGSPCGWGRDLGEKGGYFSFFWPRLG